jgi:hypothetical protein
MQRSEDSILDVERGRGERGVEERGVEERGEEGETQKA